MIKLKKFLFIFVFLFSFSFLAISQENSNIENQCQIILKNLNNIENNQKLLEKQLLTYRQTIASNLTSLAELQATNEQQKAEYNKLLKQISEQQKTYQLLEVQYQTLEKKI